MKLTVASAGCHARHGRWPALRAPLAAWITALACAGCGGGGGYSAPAAPTAPVTPVATGTISLLAGSTGSVGDGTGTGARFNNPNGLALDSAGNIVVAEGGSHTVRRVTPAGVASTVAGSGVSGDDDGAAATATFNTPTSVAVDGAGNIYVANRQVLPLMGQKNNPVRKVTPAGLVSTLIAQPSPSQSQDESGPYFQRIDSTAVDSAGNVYVGETNSFPIIRARSLFGGFIRKISPDGTFTTLAGRTDTSSSSSVDGIGSAASFGVPRAMTVDGAGNIYVGDYSNSTIRKVTPAGVVTTLAGKALESGSTDGAGANARFASIVAMALDAGGNLYVAEDTIPPAPTAGLIFTAPPIDDGRNSIIRKVTPAGVVTTVAGTPLGTAGTQLGNLPGSLAHVRGITAGPGNVLYLSTEAGLLKVQLP